MGWNFPSEKFPNYTYNLFNIYRTIQTFFLVTLCQFEELCFSQNLSSLYKFYLNVILYSGYIIIILMPMSSVGILTFLE